MSAWIVNKRHIDVLVNAMITARVIDREDATKIGTTLWQENHTSVNYRYSGKDKCPPYRFAIPSLPKYGDPAYCFMQARCYAYQTCEHDGWETSEAKKLIDDLCMCLGYDLAKAACKAKFGKDLCWGVDDTEPQPNVVNLLDLMPKR